MCLVYRRQKRKSDSVWLYIMIAGRFWKHAETQDQVKTTEKVSDRIVRIVPQACGFVGHETLLLLQQTPQRPCLGGSHQENERNHSAGQQKDNPRQNKHVPF